MSTTSSRPLVDTNMEYSVLGAIMLSPPTIRTLIVDDGLHAGAFYSERLRIVFGAMTALANRDEGIDPRTVVAELQRQGKLDEAGGADFIEELTGTVPMVGNVRAYAARVLELSELRQIQRAGHELAAGAQAEDRERIKAGERLLAVRGRPEATMLSAQALTDTVFDYMSSPIVPAFPFPFDRLNKACGGGMRRGGTTLVGGWTGHGKSVFVDQVLAHVLNRPTLDGGKASAHLYINEMTPEERALRNASREANVSYERLLEKRLTETEQTKLAVALRRGLPFGVTDAAGWSAEEIASDIRWRKWDVAAVDILHNVEYRDERDIANAMQVLVAAALQSRSHLLITVHLNEERAKDAILPPPVKRDIRASGMLKNLAHNVLFVHQAMELNEGGEVAVFTGEAGIYFDKQRSGRGGGERVTFLGDKQHFVLPPRPSLGG